MCFKICICFVVCVQSMFNVNSLPINNNNQCKTKANGLGICVKPSKCPAVITNQIQIGMYNKCETRGFICCPNSNDLDYKSQTKMADSNKLITAIVNGKHVRTHQYPFIVALGYANAAEPSGIEWKCGGSIISSNLILTAAHCLGATNIMVGRSNLTGVQARNTITDFEFIPFDKQNTNAGPKDIAIIKLKQHLVFNDNVNMIQILQKANISDQKATVLGFGAPQSRKSFSKVLSRVELNKLGCRQEVSTEKQICYGFSSGKSRGTCFGDSGSPLFVKESSGQFIQLGIVSYVLGRECARRHEPTVFVKVKYYMDWINSHM